MTNDQAILKGDRLDSGMKAGEAVARAREWWDRHGRHIAQALGDADPVLRAQSGICAGNTFGALSRREAVQVVKVWHHTFVRRADVLDIAPDAPFKLGGEETVQ